MLLTVFFRMREEEDDKRKEGKQIYDEAYAKQEQPRKGMLLNLKMHRLLLKEIAEEAGMKYDRG